MKAANLVSTAQEKFIFWVRAVAHPGELVILQLREIFSTKPTNLKFRAVGGRCQSKCPARTVLM